MTEDKELPSEYISIRQIWLQGINDCRKAISQVASMEDVSALKIERDTGERTIVHTVNALYLSLVDFGEALIRTDVDKWMQEYCKPENKKIWGKIQKKEVRGRIVFAGTSDEDGTSEVDISAKWKASAKLACELYDYIIQTLNKYGMLFQEQPQGYSNVEMKSV